MGQASGVVRSPSGTVTFLLTDVESSTRAWQADAATTAAAIARHEEILAGASLPTAGTGPSSKLGVSNRAELAALATRRRGSAG